MGKGSVAVRALVCWGKAGIPRRRRPPAGLHRGGSALGFAAPELTVSREGSRDQCMSSDAPLGCVFPRLLLP